MWLSARCSRNHPFKVRADLSGGQVACPKCGEHVLVPTPQRLRDHAAPTHLREPSVLRPEPDVPRGEQLRLADPEPPSASGWDAAAVAERLATRMAASPEPALPSWATSDSGGMGCLGFVIAFLLLAMMGSTFHVGVLNVLRELLGTLSGE